VLASSRLSQSWCALRRRAVPNEEEWGWGVGPSAVMRTATVNALCLFWRLAPFKHLSLIVRTATRSQASPCHDVFGRPLLCGRSGSQVVGWSEIQDLARCSGCVLCSRL
jgi:hypothetical protein